MSDLVEFLAARLDEDERVANEAAKEIVESLVPMGLLEEQPDEHLALAARWQAKVWLFSRQAFADLGRWGTKELATWGADHIARHDPARVLADVASKRLIIAEHAAVHGVSHTGPICSSCGEVGNLGSEEAVVEWPCRTLRLLALPYAGHLEYLPEWAPDE